MMNTIKRFWACLDTHIELALYKYAIIIIIYRSSIASNFVCQI